MRSPSLQKIKPAQAKLERGTLKSNLELRCATLKAGLL